MIKFVKYSREEYLNSVKLIKDFETLKFSKQALEWWDNYYSWEKNPPLCLRDNNKDICYLFYTISKDNEYLNIHNIFTPKNYRNNNYAYKMIEHLFNTLMDSNIKRFKLYSVSSSIKFYMKLGLKFWGVNESGQYYCDFKMPQKNINELKSIVKNENIENIGETNLIKIFEKLKLNGSEFDEKQTFIHNQCLDLMGNNYLFNELDKAVKKFNK